MFIYNTSLIILFWTLFNLITTNFKTLYSFSNLSFNSFYLLSITIILLSMAGVPPFIGFFSKLFLVKLLINNSFFLLYSLLFVVLFLGLYFYVQNLRFLHSTNSATVDFPFSNSNERVNINLYYITIIFLFITSFGLLYIDDILLYITWINL